MRIPIIAGNWKMNMTTKQALELVKGIHYSFKNPGNVEVIVAPTALLTKTVADAVLGSYIRVAVQNVYHKDSGAFTGEISAVMAKDVGADYAIIGHSERRQYFGETDESVNLKVKSCFANNIIPIVCVGETLQERESGQLHKVIGQQVVRGLHGLNPKEAADVVVAYEPVWAIGTGKTATGQEAEEAHFLIRSLLTEMFGTPMAEKIRILYGGSVKSENAKELLSFPNIDGALVGGASLKVQDFIGIIQGLH